MKSSIRRCTSYSGDFTNGDDSIVAIVLYCCLRGDGPVRPETSSSSYCSTTLYAEFWPSQAITSVLFYPGQGSSSLVLLASVMTFHVPVYNHRFVFHLTRFGLCPLIHPAFFG